MEKAHTSTSRESPGTADAPKAEHKQHLVERGPSGTALYVHLPFCETKCHYCDFFSVPALGQDIDGTLEAVLAEARTRAPLNPKTVFIGGGTPSLLDEKQLEHFLSELDAITRFTESAVEVTLESNPESVTRDKVALMMDHGVRRLSIGFQSLEQETLALFGRVHSVDQSFRAHDAARAAGMEDLNLDLIYAAPGQDGKGWESALQRVLELEPNHLSAYNLAFEEDTVFSRWLRSGEVQKLPEEVELMMFHTTRERTAAHGLRAYEISNYAQPRPRVQAQRKLLGKWQLRRHRSFGGELRQRRTRRKSTCDRALHRKCERRGPRHRVDRVFVTASKPRGNLVARVATQWGSKPQ